MTEWLEYQEAQQQSKETDDDLHKGKSELGRWEAPEKGWIKINTDAALQQ